MQAERASRMAGDTRIEARRATMLATASGVVHDSRDFSRKMSGHIRTDLADTLPLRWRCQVNV